MPTGIYERPSPEECFWSRVNKTETCWLWTGLLDDDGYGRFQTGHFKLAHRFAYELLVKPVPREISLDHRPTCPKNCVNPDHLRPATTKQNQENRVGAQSNSGSGVRGVSWNSRKGKWQVKVQHNGKGYSGGYFRLEQLAEAGAAAIALRNRLFTHNDADRVQY